MIYENLAHEARADSKEVRPVLEIRTGVPYQPDIEFVHQRRRLERILRTLRSEVKLGQAAQLAVNNGNQLTQRALVTLPPARNQSGDTLFGGCHAGILLLRTG